MPLQAVLFDLDGTLVDSEPTHARALLDVLSGEGIAVPEDFFHGLIGHSFHHAHQKLVTSHGLRLSFQDLQHAKHAAYLERRAELDFRAGAAEALGRARALGLAIAAVSNSDRIVVNANLAAIGLTRPEQISVSRNDVREGKPAPEPYLRAAWLLGLEPAQCLVVEDSAPGATAGLAAGMAVIGWPEDHCRDLPFPAGTTACRDDALAQAIVAWCRAA